MNTLIYNPTATGRSGFHAVRTALRFTLDKGEIKDLEVIELENKGAVKSKEVNENL